MHLDKVQNLEYAITTPLLFCIILASSSPTVPTGMVQQLFMLMLGSQILCTGVLDMSSLTKRMMTECPDYIHASSMAMTAFIQLGACYVLQIVSLVIKLTFFRQLWQSMYNVDILLQVTTIMMVCLQALYLVSLLLHTIANVVPGGWQAASIARWASTAYMLINFVLKFVIGWLAFSTAVNKSFPSYACGIWGRV